jgi:hypothetical protein
MTETETIANNRRDGTVDGRSRRNHHRAIFDDRGKQDSFHRIAYTRDAGARTRRESDFESGTGWNYVGYSRFCGEQGDR